MIVNNRMTNSYLMDLTKTFQVLKKFNMYLNLTKCILEVNLGKFFDFIMHWRDLDANPKKIRVKLDMHPPWMVRKIQRLIGQLVVLSRFLS